MGVLLHQVMLAVTCHLLGYSKVLLFWCLDKGKAYLLSALFVLWHSVCLHSRALIRATAFWRRWQPTLSLLILHGLGGRVMCDKIDEATINENIVVHHCLIITGLRTAVWLLSLRYAVDPHGIRIILLHSLIMYRLV